MSTSAGLRGTLSAVFDRAATLAYQGLAKIGLRLTFYYLYSLGPEHPSVQNRSRRREVICLPDPSPTSDEAAITAYVGGERAGRVALTAMPSYIPRIKATWDAEGALIYDLMVLKEGRRQGIGRSLLTAAIEANAGTKLYAMVFVTNMPSRRLFESCGFRIEGRLFYVEVFGKAIRNAGSLRYLKVGQ